MAEVNSEKLQVLSLKVNTATKDRFAELKEDGAFDTAGQFMETLLERYSNPLKINRENENVIKTSKHTIEQLNQELESVKAMNNQYEQTIKSLNDKIADIENTNKQTIDDLNSNFENSKQNLLKDHIMVPISQLERKCLQYLTARENKERKRNDITPEVFFMYCLSEMLIKGNKFSIKCVPDNVIEQFKKELAHE